MTAPEQQAAPEQADLRQRIAQTLCDAAHECDGDCGLTEDQCFEQHPIQVSARHFGEITSVYGDIDALAEVAATAVQPELAALREQLAAAQAENERLATALEVATVQHAKALKDRDKARTSAKISDDIQRAEKQLFDTAIRDLGGNPVDVQNLYAQLRSRTQQWKNAQTALANQDAEIDRLGALLAHDHHLAYHQGEPRDDHRNCGRDSCTAPAARPSI